MKMKRFFITATLGIILLLGFSCTKNHGDIKAVNKQKFIEQKETKQNYKTTNKNRSNIDKITKLMDFWLRTENSKDVFPMDLCKLIEKYIGVWCANCECKNLQGFKVCFLCKIPLSHKIVSIKDNLKCKCLKTLTGHTDYVNSLAYLGNNLLASASDDKTIKIWNIENGKCLKTLTGHTDYVYSLAYLGNNLLAANNNDDKTLKDTNWTYRRGW